jgi:VIT1/CCC1 family predicted Fe2+/Mn2+ transporter
MTPETLRIIYWTTNSLFCLGMLMSAIQYLTKPEMKAAFSHLGYPSYFRVELAIAKILGVFVLVFPIFGVLKEWAYAGFTITLVSAMIAHLNRKDPPKRVMMPFIFLVLLMASYGCFRDLL